MVVLKACGAHLSLWKTRLTSSAPGFQRFTARPARKPPFLPAKRRALPTKAPHQPSLLCETLRALNHPGGARTGLVTPGADVNKSAHL
jgi:hypothetical protein